MSTPPPPPWYQPAALARRGWFKLTAGLLAIAGLGLAWRQKPTAAPALTPAQRTAAMVERLADIFVPHDADSPGAVELGLHRQLVDSLATRPAFSRALDETFRVLDSAAVKAHGQAFLPLSAAQQDALMRQLAAQPQTSPGRGGLLQLRQHTLLLYYAQPQAVAALGMGGAPQPVGYVDYTQAPVRRS